MGLELPKDHLTETLMIPTFYLYHLPVTFYLTLPYLLKQMDYYHPPAYIREIVRWRHHITRHQLLIYVC